MDMVRLTSSQSVDEEEEEEDEGCCESRCSRSSVRPSSPSPLQRCFHVPSALQLGKPRQVQVGRRVRTGQGAGRACRRISPGMPNPGDAVLRTVNHFWHCTRISAGLEEMRGRGLFRQPVAPHGTTCRSNLTSFHRCAASSWAGRARVGGRSRGTARQGLFPPSQ